MSSRKDGGYAFPTGNSDVGIPYEFRYGMTLRDWFAGQVLASAKGDGGHVDDMAAYAYRIADAMIEARKEKP
jgi:hypothetical protein